MMPLHRVDAREIRNIIGAPFPQLSDKKKVEVDDTVLRFIAHSPFVVLASSDNSGAVDCSPRGDLPGFVRVLGPTRVALPDSAGNRLADTLLNICQSPQIGMLFVIPGVRETLRLNGRAFVTDDRDLLDSFTVDGKTPHLSVVVDVDEVYLHCGKSMIRSGLWDESTRELARAAVLDRDIWSLQGAANSNP